MNTSINPQLQHSHFNFISKYSESGYEGKCRFNKKSTTIQFIASTDFLYTTQLPATVRVLQEYLPSIFHCQCFNDEHLPFCKELENTELAHLFEHILLEFLCKVKLEKGENFADYSGQTKWNWKRTPRGTFQIQINIGKNESSIFTEALQKTIALMNLIIEESSSTYALDNQATAPILDPVLQPVPAMAYIPVNSIV